MQNNMKRYQAGGKAQPVWSQVELIFCVPNTVNTLLLEIILCSDCIQYYTHWSLNKTEEPGI